MLKVLYLFVQQLRFHNLEIPRALVERPVFVLHVLRQQNVESPQLLRVLREYLHVDIHDLKRIDISTMLVTDND